MNLPNFNIFKDLSDKYFLSAFPGAILSIIIIGLLTSSYVLAALFAIVWIIVCATTCEIIKNKRLNKINKDLDECRVHAYIKQYEELVANCSKNKNYLLLNLAIGYIEIGDNEHAYNILKSIEIINKKHAISVVPAIFYYYNNLATTCIALEKFDETEDCINKMKEIINDHRIQKSSLYFFNLLHFYQTLSLSFKAKKGQYELDETFYKTMLELDGSLRYRVNRHFIIAEILFKKGKVSEAVTYYEFAAQNGGDTYYAASAKKRLSVISQ